MRSRTTDRVPPPYSERQAEHLRRVRERCGFAPHTFIRNDPDSCPQCHGTGARDNGSTCIACLYRR